MRHLKLSFFVLGCALLAAFGLSLNTAAQDNTIPDDIPTYEGECNLTEAQQARLNEAVQAAFDQLERDDNGEIIPPQDWDINCGGICKNGYIRINGVVYQATWQKFICVSALQDQDLGDPVCFALLCDSDGFSDLGEIHMDQSEDAIPSRVVLTSANGQAPFNFPANVRIEFFANMDLHGLPQLSNADPMILESTEPVNSWPPQHKVDYKLVNAVDFVSADGVHTANFAKATVTMENKSAGPLVSAR